MLSRIADFRFAQRFGFGRVSRRDWRGNVGRWGAWLRRRAGFVGFGRRGFVVFRGFGLFSFE